MCDIIPNINPQFQNNKNKKDKKIKRKNKDVKRK